MKRANPSSAESFLSHAGTNGLASAGALLRPNHHPMLAPNPQLSSTFFEILAPTEFSEVAAANALCVGA
jgi:hypothetical protein